MGYQQILMLVLCVILVGTSITVGLSMFENVMVDSNRNAVISDMNIFAGVAFAYYKTPDNMGGGEHTWDVDELGMWFGFNYDAMNNTILNNNGIYYFSSFGEMLTIIGTGTSEGNDGSENVKATLLFNGETGEIVTTINN